MIRGSLRETFDLDQNGIKRLKETIRVKYTKETKQKAIDAVNEICDTGLEGNYEGTQKRVFVYPDRVIGTIWNNKKELLFVEYGAGTSGKYNPHPDPQVVEYRLKPYYKYNTYTVTVGQPSQHIFYDRVEEMKKKLKELGG